MPRKHVSNPPSKGHHRRPSSIGGSNDAANRSDVDPKIEREWHKIVVNMCAPKAAEVLTTIVGRRVNATRTGTPHHPYVCPPKKACASACLKWRVHATHRASWNELKKRVAKQMNVEEISDEYTLVFINAYLVDPDYTLSIDPEEPAAA